MKTSTNQRESNSGSLGGELKSIVKTLAACLGILWALELTDLLLLDGLLDGFGIRPREAFGLIGVLTWPLLHGGVAHLLSNTLALLLFGTLVLMWGRREFFAVSLISTIVGGLGVWLVGASGSLHIGASGVCFGYFGYLLARGFYERKFGSVVLSLVIGVLFGGTLAGAVPGLSMPGISWEGHLFGLLGGVLVARRLKNNTKREG
ncbi:MAG: rhomboid family intramembrane serine protease [Enhygromyxa sp.]